MADIVRSIEITAALSADYQAAFKSAADIAKRTGSELQKLSRRESDIQRLLALDAQKAQQAMRGEAAAVQKTQAQFDRLASRLGVTGKSAEALRIELQRIGASRKDLERLNRTASQRSQLGRLAQSIQSTQTAYGKFRDPALLTSLKAQQRQFKALGGAIPSPSRFSGLASGLSQVVPASASLGRAFGMLKGVLAGPAGIVVGLAGVGVAAVAAAKKLTQLGLDAMKSGDHIIKTADALGISTDAFQGLAYAMERGGASEEDFTTALRTMTKQLDAANRGSASARKAFANLGVSASELKGMNAEEAFYALADGISKIEDPAKRMEASTQLLGRGGYKIAEAMSGGAESLDELRKAAAATGNLRSRKELERAAKAADMMTDAQMTLKGAMNEIGYAVLPSLIEGLNKFSTFVQENRDSIKAFADGAGAFMSGVVTGIGALVDGVTVSGQVIWEGLKWWGRGFKWVYDAMRPLDIAFKNFVLAIPDMLTSAGQAIMKFFDSIVAFVSDKVSALVETVTGIPDKIQQTLADIPGIGEFFASDGSSAASAGASAKPVQITVQTNVDARGAASDTSAGVKRALSESSPVTAQGVQDALNAYGALAVG